MRVIRILGVILTFVGHGAVDLLELVGQLLELWVFSVLESSLIHFRLSGLSNHIYIYIISEGKKE